MTLSKPSRPSVLSTDVLSVTGLAKQDFEVDLIVWSGSFVRRHRELKGAIKLQFGLVQ